jgi:DNA replication protein DnaC
MMTMSEHQKKCILNPFCKVAGTDVCNDFCGQYIAIHGRSGEGIRAGKPAGIPKEYALEMLQNSKVREQQPDAYDMIDSYEQSFVKIFNDTTDVEERMKNVYLWSENKGTGKTYTAVCILNSFLSRYYIGCLKRGIQPVQKPIYFLDFNKLHADYSQMTRQGVPRDIAEESGERYYAALENAKTALFTCFDEMGVRTVSENMLPDILGLLNHRIYEMKPSIYTSNLRITQLPTIFKEERVFDRVRDLTIEIEFTGESHRGHRE